MFDNFDVMGAAKELLGDTDELRKKKRKDFLNRQPHARPRRNRRAEDDAYALGANQGAGASAQMLIY